MEGDDPRFSTCSHTETAPVALNSSHGMGEKSYRVCVCVTAIRIIGKYSQFSDPKLELRTAIFVYILYALPVIFTSGAFGGLLCFLLGCCCSVVACVISFVSHPLWHALVE